MSQPPAADVTQLLVAWSEGDQSALDRLVPLVESELRRLAKGWLMRWLGSSGSTQQGTDDV